MSDHGDMAGAVDDVYDVAVELVVQTQFGSVSMLQRKLRIGYGRAIKLMERMVAEGIVAQGDGSTRARPVLMRPDELAALRGQIANVPLAGLDVEDQAVDDDLDDDLEADDDGDGDGEGSRSETRAERAERLGLVQLVGIDDISTVVLRPRVDVIVTVDSAVLAQVLSEAAMFGDARDVEPLCWLELSVAGGYLHAMATTRYVAGWSRTPLYPLDPDDVDTETTRERSIGWDEVHATAFLHIDDAKLLARAVKHRGKVDPDDRAIVQFARGAVTVERVDIAGQRDVRMTLTDYNGTTLNDVTGQPIGMPAIDRLIGGFVPSEEPIDPSLRLSSQLLAPFARVADFDGDGTRVLFGRSTVRGARLMLLRVGDTFTGLLNSRSTHTDSGEPSGLPIDEVGPGEAGYRRAEVTQ